MKFEAIARETVLLDPGNDMAPKNIPNEIRKDPLTGKTARICHFRELEWKKPDLEELVAGTESWCPFCPDKVLKVTPCFAADILPEGRMTLDDKVLFYRELPPQDNGEKRRKGHYAEPAHLEEGKYHEFPEPGKIRARVPHYEAGHAGRARRGKKAVDEGQPFAARSRHRQAQKRCPYYYSAEETRYNYLWRI